MNREQIFNSEMQTRSAELRLRIGAGVIHLIVLLIVGAALLAGEIFPGVVSVFVAVSLGSIWFGLGELRSWWYRVPVMLAVIALALVCLNEAIGYFEVVDLAASLFAMQFVAVALLTWLINRALLMNLKPKFTLKEILLVVTVLAVWFGGLRAVIVCFNISGVVLEVVFSILLMSIVPAVLAVAASAPLTIERKLIGGVIVFAVFAIWNAVEIFSRGEWTLIDDPSFGIALTSGCKCAWIWLALLSFWRWPKRGKASPIPDHEEI